ncbi:MULTISPECIES: integration host factor, actinobacterial type [Rhodococcus]|uniref:integration host factor, actinobacterial type n=1 Tax=Rhodococcus TaxID=1827 RepID=UPI00110E39A5|nr:MULTISPECIES: integration host factor, actinobacterial type [Rhodococcus]MBX4171178.1 integration host factor [Rhodococcus sp. DMU2021]MDJ0401474.1 integration host factor, actinobacterial type [Rhodococcus rhodochrous]QXF83993.1 integration host factor [Rhodococcus pyridinivorans]
MPLPQLSPEARQQALAKAGAARRTRALVKEDLKKGRVEFHEVMQRAETDEVLAKMKVIDLIAALPKFGKTKASAVMVDLDIAENRSIRGLGQNQRGALLQRFAS